jgi:hypothetical protein
MHGFDAFVGASVFEGSQVANRHSQELILTHTSILIAEITRD